MFQPSTRFVSCVAPLLNVRVTLQMVLPWNAFTPYPAIVNRYTVVGRGRQAIDIDRLGRVGSFSHCVFAVRVVSNLIPLMRGVPGRPMTSGLGSVAGPCKLTWTYGSSGVRAVLGTTGRTVLGLTATPTGGPAGDLVVDSESDNRHEESSRAYHDTNLGPSSLFGQLSSRGAG
jgi:hypothetical protein